MPGKHLHNLFPHPTTPARKRQNFCADDNTVDPGVLLAGRTQAQRRAGGTDGFSFAQPMVPDAQ
jgi:hypothetical protein